MDDLIWNEPLYDWDQLYVDTLTRLHEAGCLDLVPDKWREHGREGSIRIPAGSPWSSSRDRGRSARGQQPH